jgi:Protein of unknown function (DUF669).
MSRVINVGQEAYKGGDYTPIPTGTQLIATVYAIEEVPVKSGPNQGKPQLDVTFKVQGGQYNGREIRYQKIPLYDGPAAWKLVTFADAVGWDTKPAVQLPDNLQSVLGTSLMIKVREDEPNAKKQVFNSVTGYAKANGSAATAAAASPTATPSWGSLTKA